MAKTTLEHLAFAADFTRPRSVEVTVQLLDSASDIIVEQAARIAANQIAAKMVLEDGDIRRVRRFLQALSDQPDIDMNLRTKRD